MQACWKKSFSNSSSVDLAATCVKLFPAGIFLIGFRSHERLKGQGQNHVFQGNFTRLGKVMAFTRLGRSGEW